MDPHIRDGHAEDELQDSRSRPLAGSRASRLLQQHIAALQSRLSEILPTIPAELKATAASCDDQAATPLATVESITAKTYVGSLLAEPVDEDDATLSPVIRLCIDDLNGKLADGVFARIGAQLTARQQAITDHIGMIDVARARRLAARDMVFARDAVRTNRYEEAHAKRQRTLTPASLSVPATAVMAYQLSTEVPEHWIPLVPRADENGGHAAPPLGDGRRQSP